MSSHDPEASNLSMLELFRAEAENQNAILTSGLIELEQEPGALGRLEPLMRAAHSLKGAARIVSFHSAVRVAHAMEDWFVAAQGGRLIPRQGDVDLLFQGVDLLQQISRQTEANIGRWEEDHAGEINAFLDSVASVIQAPGAAMAGAPTPAAALSPTEAVPPAQPGGATPASPELMRAGHETPERVVRLGAENLNRLLGLAGESLVESRWLRPFADSLQRLKRRQGRLSEKLEDLRQRLNHEGCMPHAEHQVGELMDAMAGCQQLLSERLQELDVFERRSAQLSQRMYLEVLRARMRPFGDGIRRFPRMVRDLARALGKEVRLEIGGENTPVDRDILERLEAPLAHLLRNAVDHGCELPEEREQAGKPRQATIHLEARHSAGMLLVTVADDGPGVELEQVREAVLQRQLATTADKLSESELLQFLLKPGFTLKQAVTEISGRGVGLDVVQSMVRSVRGSLRVASQPGCGLRVQLQLPLTLSVLRALLVEVAGEPYAFPLKQITRAIKLQQEQIDTLENRHHFRFAGQQVGLLAAHHVLECGEAKASASELPVIVLGDQNSRYGLVVDRFLGERELVVQPLDSRLGKVKDVSAAALMEDGAPVLILDVDEMLGTIETMVSGCRLTDLPLAQLRLPDRKQKRILAVDDSLTVRELVRKLLTSYGYEADVAVDGEDGWNAVRSGHYDLVITDVDMPRMDGVKLAALIKQDARLKDLPVMVVSYKDREEDRLRGLEAGADYYITKGAFHDETLLQAVVDLIGEPES